MKVADKSIGELYKLRDKLQGDYMYFAAAEYPQWGMETAARNKCTRNLKQVEEEIKNRRSTPFICKCGHEIEANPNTEIQFLTCSKCGRVGHWDKLY